MSYQIKLANGSFTDANDLYSQKVLNTPSNVSTSSLGNNESNVEVASIDDLFTPSIDSDSTLNYSDTTGNTIESTTSTNAPIDVPTETTESSSQTTIGNSTSNEVSLANDTSSNLSENHSNTITSTSTQDTNITGKQQLWNDLNGDNEVQKTSPNKSPLAEQLESNGTNSGEIGSSGKTTSPTSSSTNEINGNNLSSNSSNEIAPTTDKGSDSGYSGLQTSAGSMSDSSTNSGNESNASIGSLNTDSNSMSDLDTNNGQTTGDTTTSSPSIEQQEDFIYTSTTDIEEESASTEENGINVFDLTIDSVTGDEIYLYDSEGNYYCISKPEFVEILIGLNFSEKQIESVISQNSTILNEFKNILKEQGYGDEEIKILTSPTATEEEKLYVQYHHMGLAEEEIKGLISGELSWDEIIANRTRSMYEANGFTESEINTLMSNDVDEATKNQILYNHYQLEDWEIELIESEDNNFTLEKVLELRFETEKARQGYTREEIEKLKSSSTPADELIILQYLMSGVFTEDEIEKIRSEEMSKEDIMKTLYSRLGYTEEDINRLINNEITMEELNIEIMRDDSKERLERIKNAQEFFQIKQEITNKSREEIPTLEAELSNIDLQIQDLKNEREEIVNKGKKTTLSASDTKRLNEIAKSIEELELQKGEIQNQIDIINEQIEFLSDVVTYDDLVAKIKEYDDLVGEQDDLGQAVLDTGKVSETGSMTWDWEALKAAREDLGEFNDANKAEIDSNKRVIQIMKGIVDQIENDTSEQSYEINFFASVEQEDFLANSDYRGVSYDVLKTIDQRYGQPVTVEVADGKKTNAGVIVINDAKIEADLLYKMLNGDIQFNESGYFVDENGNQYPSINSSDDLVRYYSEWLSRNQETGNIMSENQIKIFNYKYNTEGAESAIEYLKTIAPYLDNRNVQQRRIADEAFANQHGILASLGSVVLGPKEGIDAFVYSTMAVNSDDAILRSDTYSTSDVWRAKVTNNIAKTYGEGWAFLYGTGMSMLDSVEMIGLTALLGGNPAIVAVLSPVLMGSRVYVSTLNDALDRGLSDTQAVQLAFSASVVESLMEAYSVGHLLHLESHVSVELLDLINRKVPDPRMQDLMRAFAGILSQSLAEGEEELCTDIVNALCDQVIAGDMSEFSTSIDDYMSKGLSYEEAFTKAFGDAKDQWKMSFLGGVLSGIGFGGVSSLGSLTYNTSHKTAIQMAQELGLDLNDSTTQEFINKQTGLLADEAYGYKIDIAEANENKSFKEQWNDYKLSTDMRRARRISFIDNLFSKRINLLNFSPTLYGNSLVPVISSNGAGMNGSTLSNKSSAHDLIISGVPFGKDKMSIGKLSTTIKNGGADSLVSLYTSKEDCQGCHELYQKVQSGEIILSDEVTEFLGRMETNYQRAVSNDAVLVSTTQATQSADSSSVSDISRNTGIVDTSDAVELDEDNSYQAESTNYLNPSDESTPTSVETTTTTTDASVDTSEVNTSNVNGNVDASTDANQREMAQNSETQDTPILGNNPVSNVSSASMGLASLGAGAMIGNPVSQASASANSQTSTGNQSTNQKDDSDKQPSKSKEDYTQETEKNTNDAPTNTQDLNEDTTNSTDETITIPLEELIPDGVGIVDLASIEYLLGQDRLDTILGDLASIEDCEPFHELYQRIQNENITTNETFVDFLKKVDEKYNDLVTDNEQYQQLHSNSQILSNEQMEIELSERIKGITPASEVSSSYEFHDTVKSISSEMGRFSLDEVFDLENASHYSQGLNAVTVITPSQTISRFNDTSEGGNIGSGHHDDNFREIVQAIYGEQYTYNGTSGQDIKIRYANESRNGKILYLMTVDIPVTINSSQYYALKSLNEEIKAFNERTGQSISVNAAVWDHENSNLREVSEDVSTLDEILGLVTVNDSISPKYEEQYYFGTANNENHFNDSNFKLFPSLSDNIESDTAEIGTEIQPDNSPIERLGDDSAEGASNEEILPSTKKAPSISESNLLLQNSTAEFAENFSKLSVEEQLDLINNTNILFFEKVLDLDLDPRVRTLLDARLLDNIGLFSLYDKDLFLSGIVTRGRAINIMPFINYLFSNEQLVSNISDSDLTRMFFVYNLVDRKSLMNNNVFMQELGKRIMDGHSMFEVLDKVVVNFYGNNILYVDTDYFLKLLPPNLSAKLLNDNIMTKVNSPLIQDYSSKIRRSQSLILYSLMENDNFGEKGKNLLNSLILNNGTKDFNFQLLNETIINDFGEKFIIDIGNYFNLSSMLVSLYEHQHNLYSFYKGLIDLYKEDTSLNSFYLKSKLALEFVFNNQSVLSNIDLSSVDLNEFTEYILTAKNLNIGDFSNEYREHFFEMCDSDFANPKILSDLKNIYFQKFFSMNAVQAQSFITTYGNHLNEISSVLDDMEGLSLRTTVNYLEYVMSLDSVDDLVTLYDSQEFTLTFEEILHLEDIGHRKYLESYANAFAETSSKIENSEDTTTIEIDGKEVRLIEMSGDFAMLVHSNDSGYKGDKDMSQGYIASWNSIDSNKTHGLATSYVTQDNIGSVPVQNNGVLYGFYDLGVKDIFAMGPFDINSNIADYGYSTHGQQEFISADNMALNTMRIYNEFVISRKDSKPSCVIIYDDSNETAVTSAYKAAAEWGIPVVRINKSTLATNQMARINSLIENYQETHNFESLRQALYLYEAGTAGFRINVIDGSATKGDGYFSSSTNEEVNSIFSPTSIINFLDNEISTIKDSNDMEKANQLLSILESIKERYDVTNLNKANNIEKTASLLNIDSYIETLNNMIESMKNNEVSTERQDISSLERLETSNDIQPVVSESETPLERLGTSDDIDSVVETEITPVVQDPIVLERLKNNDIDGTNIIPFFQEMFNPYRANTNMKNGRYEGIGGCIAIGPDSMLVRYNSEGIDSKGMAHGRTFGEMESEMYGQDLVPNYYLKIGRIDSKKSAAIQEAQQKTIEIRLVNDNASKMFTIFLDDGKQVTRYQLQALIEVLQELKKSNVSLTSFGFTGINEESIIQTPDLLIQYLTEILQKNSDNEIITLNHEEMVNELNSIKEKEVLSSIERLDSNEEIDDNELRQFLEDFLKNPTKTPLSGIPDKVIQFLKLAADDPTIEVPSDMPDAVIEFMDTYSERRKEYLVGKLEDGIKNYKNIISECRNSLSLSPYSDDDFHDFATKLFEASGDYDTAKNVFLDAIGGDSNVLSTTVYNSNIDYHVRSLLFQYDSKIIYNLASEIVDISQFKASSDLFANGTYGGNQSDVYRFVRTSLNGSSKSTISSVKGQLLLSLVDRYFSNADPLLKLKLASHYAHSGCGYMAQANNFISMMSNMENGEEIFKNRFGFDMYIIDENGRKSYNVEALAFDIYLYRYSREYNGTPPPNEMFRHSAGANISDQFYKHYFASKGFEYTVKEEKITYDDFTQSVSSFRFLNLILENPNAQFIISAGGIGMSEVNNYNRSVSRLGSHAMSLTDVSSDRNFYVSSWNGLWKIFIEQIVDPSIMTNEEGIEYSPYFKLSAVQYEMIDDIPLTYIQLDNDEVFDYTKYDNESIYSLQSIRERSHTFTIMEKLLFDLVTTNEQRLTLEDILYRGKYDNFLTLRVKSNPTSVGAYRIAMANLFLNNPETFHYLFNNHLNLFHGTSTDSNKLISILDKGLLSPSKSLENGISLQPSLLDILDETILVSTDIDQAKWYTLPKSDDKFPIIICIDSDSFETYPDNNDQLSARIEGEIPVDNIGAILVPEDKVDYVKSLVGDRNIQVLAMNFDSFYSSEYSSHATKYNITKYEALKNKLKGNLGTNNDTPPISSTSSDNSTSIKEYSVNSAAHKDSQNQEFEPSVGSVQSNNNSITVQEAPLPNKEQIIQEYKGKGGITSSVFDPVIGETIDIINRENIMVNGELLDASYTPLSPTLFPSNNDPVLVSVDVQEKIQEIITKINNPETALEYSFLIIGKTINSDGNLLYVISDIVDCTDYDNIQERKTSIDSAKLNRAFSEALNNGCSFISIAHTHPIVSQEVEETSIYHYLSDEMRKSQNLKPVGLNLSLQDLIQFESFHSQVASINPSISTFQTVIMYDGEIAMLTTDNNGNIFRMTNIYGLDSFMPIDGIKVSPESIAASEPEISEEAVINNISSQESFEFKDIVRRKLAEEDLAPKEREILEKVLDLDDNISQLTLARFLYYELGRKLDYDESMKYAAAYDRSEFERLYNKHLSFDDLSDSNRVVCVSWAQLYSQLLIDAGFRPEQIVIQRITNDGQFYPNSHAGIYVLLDDGSIIMPDLTAPIGGLDDTYNVKVNNETQGFVLFTPEQIQEILQAHRGVLSETLSDEEIKALNTSDITALVRAMKQYESYTNSNFTIENRNVYESINDSLTTDQNELLDTVGQFLFAIAAQPKGTDGRLRLEELFYRSILDENAPVIDQADHPIEHYKQNISDFIERAIYENLQVEETQELYRNMIQTDNITSYFLRLDALHNDDMITVRNYINQLIKAMDLDNPANGAYISMGKGIQVPLPDGSVRNITIKLQFTKDGGIIPFSICRDGKVVSEYTIRAINGKISVLKSSDLYRSVFESLTNRGLPSEHRTILESITPNMTEVEIKQIPQKLLSSGQIKGKYEILINNNRVEILSVLDDDTDLESFEEPTIIRNLESQDNKSSNSIVDPIWNSIFDSINDSNSLDEFLTRINNYTEETLPNGFHSVEEYKRQFIRHLIDDGYLEKITKGLSFYYLINDPIMLSELIGTDVLNKFVIANLKKVTSSNATSVISQICKLNQDDFNRLLDNDFISSFISELSPNSFKHILINFSQGTINYLQNNTLVHKLISLNDADFIEAIRDTKYYIYGFETLYDNSCYEELLDNICDRFLNEEYFEANPMVFGSLKRYLYGDIANSENEKIKRINSLYLERTDQILQKIVSSADDSIEFKSHSIHCKNNHDSYYTLTFKIDNVPYSVELIGSTMYFEQLDPNLLKAALVGNLSDVHMEPNIIKNICDEIEPSLSEGINIINIIVNGEKKQLFYPKKLHSGKKLYAKMIEKFNDKDSIQFESVIFAGNYNIHVPETGFYEVSIVTDDESVKYNCFSYDYQGIDVNSYIVEHNINVSSSTKVSTRKLSYGEYANLLYDITRFPNTSDIFSENHYGGNQSDVINLLSKYENLTMIEIQKKQLLNSLLDKYFGQIGTAERIWLATHYAKGGCSYMAYANAIATYMGSIPNGPQIFKERFGYNLYEEDGNTISYNVEALAFDIYLNHYVTLYGSDVGKIVTQQTGTNNLGTMNIFNIIKSFLNHRNIYCDIKPVTITNTNVNEIIDLNYSTLSGTQDFYIFSSSDFSMKLLSSKENDSTSLDAALSSATSTEKSTLFEHVGGHAMTITGIAENGDLIVSSWSGKYQILASGINFKNHYDIKGVTFKIL